MSVSAENQTRPNRTFATMKSWRSRDIRYKLAKKLAHLGLVEYLRKYWTDFRSLFTVWKRFKCRWWICSLFSYLSRDVEGWPWPWLAWDCRSRSKVKVKQCVFIYALPFEPVVHSWSILGLSLPSSANGNCEWPLPVHWNCLFVSNQGALNVSRISDRSTLIY